MHINGTFYGIWFFQRFSDMAPGLLSNDDHNNEVTGLDLNLSELTVYSCFSDLQDNDCSWQNFDETRNHKRLKLEPEESIASNNNGNISGLSSFLSLQLRDMYGLHTEVLGC
ncbi:hypothetical protein SLE2022_047230 [Rubroshorea leprosula]